ncbi:MAG: DUF3592 domain-containing protein, partial [Kiritimatiellae bacterium]|nr:DUF3592 domain-containing protein [Kiritimatiellia bacterium]
METDNGRKGAAGRGRGRVAAGLLVAAFAVAWLALARYVDGRERAAMRWPEVPCTVVETDTIWESGGTGRTRYSYPVLLVRYRYEWNGAAHESDVFSTNERGPRIDRVSERDRWTAVYRPGAASTCRVNPDKPDEAVLHEMTMSSVPFYCVGLGVLAVGLWLAAGPWLRRRRSGGGAADGISF